MSSPGAAALPSDLGSRRQSEFAGLPVVAAVLLPAVFPSYLTGGLTASGGAWNASVVAEVAS